MLSKKTEATKKIMVFNRPITGLRRTSSVALMSAIKKKTSVTEEQRILEQLNSCKKELAACEQELNQVKKSAHRKMASYLAPTVSQRSKIRQKSITEKPDQSPTRPGSVC